MQRLLIADTSASFAKGIQKELNDLYDVKICKDGEKLIACVCDFEPDILLLDMSIPDVDCFALLQALKLSGKQTASIALTNAATHYNLHRMEQAGVQCVLTKPCRVNLAVTHIRQVDFYLHHPDMVGWNVENETENILMDLCFSMGRSGYYALCDAISYKYRHFGSQMKEIYICVAQQRGTTTTQVEKAIRDAIVDAYKNGDANLWRMYFLPRRNAKTPYPTNEEFIARIAECLRQKTRLKKPYISKAE